jgi:hypothetical protein
MKKQFRDNDGKFCNILEFVKILSAEVKEIIKFGKEYYLENINRRVKIYDSYDWCFEFSTSNEPNKMKVSESGYDAILQYLSIRKELLAEFAKKEVQLATAIQSELAERIKADKIIELKKQLAELEK